MRVSKISHAGLLRDMLNAVFDGDPFMVDATGEVLIVDTEFGEKLLGPMMTSDRVAYDTVLSLFNDLRRLIEARNK